MAGGLPKIPKPMSNTHGRLVFDRKKGQKTTYSTLWQVAINNTIIRASHARGILSRSLSRDKSTSKTRCRATYSHNNGEVYVFNIVALKGFTLLA